MRLSSSLFFYQYSFQRNYTVENRLYHNFMTNYDNKDENFSDNYNSTFKRYNKTDILNALVNNATSREDSQYNQTDSETDESSKNISHFEEFKLNVMMSPFLRYHSAQNFTNTLESLKHLLLLLSPHYTYHLSEVSIFISICNRVGTYFNRCEIVLKCSMWAKWKYRLRIKPKIYEYNV